MSTTRNTKFIKATATKVYSAFTNPKALATWMAPENMKSKMHHFDWREGGGYEMSLFYTGNDKDSYGKTAAAEDRFKVKLTKLEPTREIVMATNFDSNDAEFAGEMRIQILFDEHPDGTNVTFNFYNIPPGIRPEDNEEGTRQSLEKLARYVEWNNDDPHPKTDSDEIDEQTSDGSANAFRDK